MNSNNNAIILSILLSESSDSSDDELIEISRFIKQRKNVPKITNYLEVINLYSDEQFQQNFRVNRETAHHLINLYANSLWMPINHNGGSEIVPANIQMLSFLWCTGNKCCIRDVADRFGIGKATFFRQCNRILDFLVNMAPDVIKFPRSEAEKTKIANEFEAVKGLPNIIGCIDGTSNTVRKPAHKIKSTYLNRHDIPAVTMQGICDANKKFLDVFTGTPGKVHDSRVFKLSTISKEIKVICNNKFYLLGDSAYALRDYLITPYRDYGNMSHQQRTFNKRICGTRVLIENAFGLLKGRFRQLICLDFHSVDKITKFIMACCVLHNLCIEKNDFLSLESIAFYNENNVYIHCNDNAQLRLLGEAKRDELCEYVNQHL